MRNCVLVAGLCLALAGCAHRAAAPAAPTAQPQDIATEYDLIYAMTHGRMSTSPSPFLVATVASLPRRGGRALDIGGGSGRNSFYLAREGYRVTDIDLSQVGLDLAGQAQAMNHLPVETVHADINQYELGTQRWDLIALIDFPFAYRALLPRIAAALKPGGVVVIQEVSTKQPGLESPDHSLTYTFMNHADLAAPFAGFRVLHDSEGEQATVWGVKAIMIRFAAVKPNA